MKMLLIAGHGAGDPGVVRFGHNEADLTREFASLLKTELSPYCDVDIADTSKNWYRHIIKNFNRFDFKPYKYVLELHFNSNSKGETGDGKTTGTEIYVTRDEAGVSAEENIVKGIASLGFKNRGVKRKNYDLIYYIKKQGVSSALLEVCFLDDKDDFILYQEKKKEIARKVAEGIAKGFKLENSLANDCKLLCDKGIINSPDYWAKGKGYSDANTVALIQKFANYVRGK
ncbi:MAG: N-acetylmuramoyl-L-alanine amidase [Oscillospiraceae bacterium]|nr:N-acetylmuramoyl-L-alanine amidase [Oscillospiraceae bacterium]